MEPPDAAAAPAPPDLQAVADAIAGYLRQHPQAVDTAPGIQRWWLLPQFGEVSLVVVEAALVQLERQGVVGRDEGAWGRPIFGRARG